MVRKENFQLKSNNDEKKKARFLEKELIETRGKAAKLESRINELQLLISKDSDKLN